MRLASYLLYIFTVILLLSVQSYFTGEHKGILVLFRISLGTLLYVLELPIGNPGFRLNSVKQRKLFSLRL